VTEDKAILDLLGPLMRALEMLALVARHVHPPDFDRLMDSVGAPDEELRAARARQGEWPRHLSGVRAALDASSDAVLEAFSGLREVSKEGGEIRSVYRALRLLPKALESLYPLAGVIPPVSRFFLDPTQRADERLHQALLDVPAQDGTGVMHFGEAERGGYWLYVPETYTADRAWPLVVALHGGSGTGRLFLWSWLRDARSRGAVLAAPTSIASTWALMGDDPDTPNLARILDAVRSRWSIDPGRLLLTGMSDGGTFTYVSVLDAVSPFTHLAPSAAAFHPLLLQMVDADRLRGLPVHITHGALDWMFPVELARQAHRALAKAGANVTYREIDDLSHTYPREINATLLDWMSATPATPR